MKTLTLKMLDSYLAELDETKAQEDAIDNHMLDIELEMYEDHGNWTMLECIDCHICMCSKEFEMVMLHNKVWFKICDDVEDILCHRCIERRLGRPIKAKDLGYGNSIWDEDPSNTSKVGCNKTFAAKHNLTYY